MSIMLFSCAKVEEPALEEDGLHSETDVVELTQEQFQMTGIRIARTERKVIGELLKVNGKMELPPESDISISVPYGGFLKNTSMLPGTKVKKGQMIAVIENPAFIDFQEQYLQSLSQKDFLLEDFKRQEQLFNEEVVSAKEYQQAKSVYEVNEARIKSSEAKLLLVGFDLELVREGNMHSSVNIYSPINGLVENVLVNVGRYVNPWDVIMDISDVEHLHVELTVFDFD